MLVPRGERWRLIRPLIAFRASVSNDGADEGSGAERFWLSPWNLGCHWVAEVWSDKLVNPRAVERQQRYA